MTSHLSLDLDCAKAILKTYQQVNDTSYAQQKNMKVQTRSKLNSKNGKVKIKDLEVEFQALQEKHTLLLKVLNSKEEMLTRLNRQLTDRTTDLERLQEDFEHAIYQFNNKLSANVSIVNAIK